MTETVGTHSGLPHGSLVPAGREGTSGPAVAGIERRVVDVDSGDDAAPGHDGELLLRGKNLMVSLDRVERAEVFRPDGWFATGDLCRLDEDGWITFRGRMGDVVKVSDANVSPLEVQQVLSQHHSVEECAIVGVPVRGELVLTAAVVVAEGGYLNPDELTAWLRKRLSSFKVPRQIIEVDASDLPRTASGKVRTAELVKCLELVLHEMSSRDEKPGGAD
jgi:acyl-coenzyme A synthetase/AMP-(fatty) acid ligase